MGKFIFKGHPYIEPHIHDMPNPWDMHIDAGAIWECYCGLWYGYDAHYETWNLMTNRERKRWLKKNG